MNQVTLLYCIIVSLKKKMNSIISDFIPLNVADVNYPILFTIPITADFLIQYFKVVISVT